MVQQMVDKFNEYRLVTSGNTMPRQSSITVKKEALRELPNETRNIISQTTPNVPLSKDSRAVFDTVKLSGKKRQQPDCSSSPSSLRIPPANTIANGHLVYVRRKLDTETGRASTCPNVDSGNSRESWKPSNEATKEAHMMREQIWELKPSSSEALPPNPVVSPTTSSQGPSPSMTVRKSTSLLSMSELKDSVITTEKPCQVDSHHAINLDYWKERFLRLQMFLKSCDQSSQDDYIRRLRSLSAVGRSKHAVELEKRAIQLLLEEGKELHRMRVLNILGKAMPNDQASISVHTTLPVQVDSLRAEKTADNGNAPWLKSA